MRQLISTIILSILIPAFAQAGWTNWTPLGGDIIGDPAACTYGNHTLVVARGTDNAFWVRTRYLPTGVWKDWKRLSSVLYPNTPLTFEGNPSVICYSYSGYITATVSAVATDRKLYFLDVSISNPGNNANSLWWWTNSERILGSPTSGLATTGNFYTRNLFMKSYPDNRLYYKSYLNENVGGVWIPLTVQATTSDPAAVSPSPSRLDVFYRDFYGRLQTRVRIGTQWNQPEQIPGIIYSAPEAISRNQSEIDLFARGPQNTLIHKRWVNGIWGNWEQLGGNIRSGPGATTYANNQRKFVFVRWADGSLYYRAWAP